MPILKKPAAGQPAKPAAPARPGNPAQRLPVRPAQAEAEEDPTDAFAQRYAGTEATAGGGYVPPPPGTYNVLITEGQGVVDGKATSAYLELTICSDVDGDETLQGKTCRMYFNFTDENGKEATGWPYFKSAMQQLGYPDDFESWAAMTDALAELANQQIWCVIDVKKKGKWTNVFLSSVPENQDEKPAYE